MDNTLMTARVDVAQFQFSEGETAYAETVVAIVAPIVGSLGKALGPRTEVLLHDLTKSPDSIVAITQSLTGRSVGGPPTDLGLFIMGRPSAEDMIGYRTETDTGVVMRSSSLFFRTPEGRPVVSLCINAELNEFLRVQAFIDSLTTTSPALGSQMQQPRETFPPSVDSLAEGILREALSVSGISVELMKKSHKVAVVRELNRRGYFTLRESVDLVADRLGVTRYTVYNYLNEIQETKSE